MVAQGFLQGPEETNEAEKSTFQIGLSKNVFMPVLLFKVLAVLPWDSKSKKS